MPSLADLEQNPPDSRRTRAFTVVLDAALVARISSLAAESLEKAKSSRQADKIALRKLEDELEGLRDQVDAVTGELLIRANLTRGEWTTFIDKHPSRPEGQPGHERDQTHAFGIVNVDALVENLDLFAHRWNDDTLNPSDRDETGTVTAPGQFDRLLKDNIPPADLVQMATTVVLFYEQSPDFGRWRSALSSGLQRLRDFAEHETSESPRSDSTGGNPEPSNAAETKTATPAP